jgi:hypothetical protein
MRLELTLGSARKRSNRPQLNPQPRWQKESKLLPAEAGSLWRPNIRLDESNLHGRRNSEMIACGTSSYYTDTA